MENAGPAARDVSWKPGHREHDYQEENPAWVGQGSS